MEGSIPSTGMIDLEEMPSLQRQQQQQQLFPFAHEFNNSPPLQHQQQQLTHAAYGIGGGANGSRGKQHPLVLGSEDEHAFADHAAAADAGTKRTAQPSSAAAASPWQRMKWTDGMVRLLIMVVYCIGDDGTGTEAADQHQQQQQQPSVSKAKKSQATAAAAGLLLQKKGKWKSVSRAMMEKGFYVSPQQCEDKFNDLNKRYKRVNDLLGKGTACRVVENQSLLDTMDHLSPKAKEEARKLLNSKHLFFREMCAYHNSGGGGGGGGGTGTAASCSSSLALSQPLLPSQQALHESQQQCSHHQLNSAHRFTGKRGHEDNAVDDEDDMHDDRDEDADNDDDADDDYDDADDDYDDDILSHDKKQQNHHQQQQQLQRGSKDEEDKEFKAAKKARTSLLMSASSMSPSPPLSLSLSASPAAAATTSTTSMQQLKCEMLESLAAIVGEQQQRHWLRKKAAELEEQRLGYQWQALELKRQRLKWLRFSSNKEHEMKRMKLHNERLCLENDRLLLLLHQKEHEITNANCNPSSVPAKFAADHFNCT